MALPGSGDIRLSDLIAEFGGGTKLSDFYRGGAYVPDTPTNAGVPASGDISLSDFYGASVVSDTVTVNSQSVSHIDFAGTSTTYAGIWYQSGGDVYKQHGSTGNTDIDDWIDPKTSAPGSYEIRATLASGTSPAGAAVGSWLALTTGRSWTLTSNAGQYKTCQLTIEIRKDGVVLDSGTVTLTADSAGS